MKPEVQNPTSPATSAQLEQIDNLGGKPDPKMTKQEALEEIMRLRDHE